MIVSIRAPASASSALSAASRPALTSCSVAWAARSRRCRSSIRRLNTLIPPSCIALLVSPAAEYRRRLHGKCHEKRVDGLQGEKKPPKRAVELHEPFNPAAVPVVLQRPVSACPRSQPNRDLPRRSARRSNCRRAPRQFVGKRETGDPRPKPGRCSHHRLGL